MKMSTCDAIETFRGDFVKLTVKVIKQDIEALPLILMMFVSEEEKLGDF